MQSPREEIWPASPSVSDADEYSSESSASPMSVSSTDSVPASPDDSLDAPFPSSSRPASPSENWWQDYPPYVTFNRIRWYRDDRGLWKENPRTSRSPYRRPAASETKPSSEKLLDAVRRGNANELESCIKSYATNLNVLGVAGDSPLHEGCRRGNLEIVKILVRHGANPELANRDGWSPLHLAVWSGSQDVAYYLLSLSRR